MDDETIINDFEIIRALYHGNYLDALKFERAKQIIFNLDIALKEKLKNVV